MIKNNSTEIRNLSGDLSDSKLEEFAIIGAGPIGIYLSYLLLKLGKRVCLIEAGGLNEEGLLLNRASYTFRSPSALPESAHRIGGGGNLWFRRCGEFLPRDFRPISGFRDTAWPISKTELDPYYRAVYSDFLNDNRLDSQVIDELSTEVPRLNLEELQFRIHRVIESERIEKITKEVLDHPNLKLLSNTYCQEILPQRQSNAESYELKLFNSSNVESRIRTKKLIIAGGALQSPALVLRSTELFDESRGRYIPGSYLMEHIEGFIGYLDFKSEVECRNFMEVFTPKDRTETGERITVGIGLALSNSILDSLSLGTLHLEFFPYRLLPLIEDWECRFLRRFGFSHFFTLVNRAHSFLFKSYVRVLRKNLKQRIVLWVKSEEIPFQESSIQIDSGDFRRVVYGHKLSETSVKNFQKSLRLLSPLLEDYAVAELRIRRRVLRNYRHFSLRPNWHPMGTLRMGSSVKDSFCDRNLQVHGHPDLYVINAAVFPAGSNANPVFTSLALANRFVDFIRLNDR